MERREKSYAKKSNEFSRGRAIAAREGNGMRNKATQKETGDQRGDEGGKGA